MGSEGEKHLLELLLLFPFRFCYSPSRIWFCIGGSSEEQPWDEEEEKENDKGKEMRRDWGGGSVGRTGRTGLDVPASPPSKSPFLFFLGITPGYGLWGARLGGVVACFTARLAEISGVCVRDFWTPGVDRTGRLDEAPTLQSDDLVCFSAGRRLNTRVRTMMHDGRRARMCEELRSF